MKRLFNGSRKKQFAMIVRKLPGALKHRYGADDFYTPGQVRATARVLQIRDRYVPFALAVLCTKEEFLSADPQHTASAYDERRDLVADETRLAEADLSGSKLVSLYTSNQSGPGQTGHEGIIGADDSSGE